VGVLFLYFLFPSALIKNHLEKSLAQSLPGYEATIDALHLSFPPALSITGVSIAKEKAPLFSMDYLKVYPDWRSLLALKKTVRFKGKAAGGDLSGKAVFTSDKIAFSGDISGASLESLVSANSSLSISGTAHGTFQGDITSGELKNAQGDLSLTSCELVLKEPFLDIFTLSFTEIQVEYSIDNKILKILKSDFNGEDLTATLSGSITLESPAERSKLNLELALFPESAFLSRIKDGALSGILSLNASGQNGFNLKVTGSLSSPTVGLGSSDKRM